ncbi:unnamed protein product [Moneuplotes crassus]|uniref:Uncharacterized protein n=1 Tax=Euplotes crassus TaxID=5936 RepID=A0A7S3KQK7_EUPCR|nr:unnamed protein product [Moneuplotes crassus]|mmetsp:Transcript_36561/g.36162  ORF Transcript_36561/g.36162 Transcript_36561/m.36162 type:complete len:256 (+) Transcript_36561:37-804(+)
MTTAHKPTWHSAKGGSNQGGNVMITPTRQYSAKDLPGHLELKTRAKEQGIDHDLNDIDQFKKELLQREKKYFEKKGDTGEVPQSLDDGFKMPKKREIKDLSKKADDLNSRNKEYEDELNEKGTPFPQDADYQSESDSGSSSDSESNSASEDDEEEAALLKEYIKIKKEKEEAEKKKLEEKAKAKEEEENKELMHENPLFNKEADENEGVYTLQRKWYDETVFKNQARIQKKEKKRFINDTVRSDFHRNFMNRFIQ